MNNAPISVGDQIEMQRNQQAMIGMEWEVRQAAKQVGIESADIDGLVNRARMVFVAKDGLARATVDGKLLRGADGGLVSPSEWVKRELGVADPAEWQGVNPFRRETWNLTEQMRLQRRDPELARRLRAEG